MTKRLNTQPALSGAQETVRLRSRQESDPAGQERSFDLTLEAMTNIDDVFTEKNSLYHRKINMPIEFRMNWNMQRHKSNLFLLQEHR